MNYVEDKERIKRLQEAYERRSKGIYDSKDDEIIKEQQEKIASVGKTVETHGKPMEMSEETKKAVDNYLYMAKTGTNPLTGEQIDFSDFSEEKLNELLEELKKELELIEKNKVSSKKKL